jgi:hypothetical protein
MRWPRLAVLAVGLLVLEGVVVGSVGAVGTALPVGNLVKNPGAEVPSGGAYITRNVAASAWMQGEADDGKGMQVVRYGGHPYLADKTVSTAIGGGKNYFIGGYPSRLSTAFQVIDVSGAGADIDAGGVKACLSAYLGGTTTSASSAQIRLTFLDEGQSGLGELRIGPVTRGKRLDKSVLLRRASERAVPRNATCLLARRATRTRRGRSRCVCARATPSRRKRPAPS